MDTPFVAYTKFPDLEKYGDEYFIVKAPWSLPDPVKEFLAKYGPYAILVFAVLGILSYLSLYSAYSTFSGYGWWMMGGYSMMGRGYGGYFWTPTMIISIIASLIALILQIRAFPSLLARKKEGWEYIIYASLVSLVPALVNVQIFGFLLGFLLSMYILFQLKYLYK